MTKIIAFFNQSGGVGKTTLCQNIGYQLAETYGKRVLLVDSDPQGSLTDFMGLELEKISKTIYEALVSEEQVALPVYQNIHGMDLCPTTIDLAQAEQQLILLHQREYRLKQSIEPISQNYDYILIDCPPSLGILSVNALVAANYIFVPIQTQYKALRGADALLKTVQSVRARMNPSLKIAGFCPTMYSRANELDRDVLETITKELGQIGTIFPSVPRATAIADASRDNMPFAASRKKQAEIIEIFDKIASGLEAMS